MIYLTIIGFALLLYWNYHVSKNFLYPPSLFVGVWLLSVIGLALSGDAFYPVSTKTLTIYLVGAAAFSIGGWIFLLLGVKSSDVMSRTNIGPHVRYLMRSNSVGPLRLNASSRSIPAAVNRRGFSHAQVARIRKALDIILVITLIGLPFYLSHIYSGVNLSDPLFFAQLRTSAVDASANSSRSFSFLANLDILAMILAMAMHYENDGTSARKWRAYLSIAMALIYGSLMGTKGNAVILLMTLMFMSFVRRGRVNFKVLGTTLALIVVLFGYGLLYVNFAYLENTGSPPTFSLISTTIENYWIGGLVAFERIAQTPTSIESTQNIDRFFLETANGLGAHFNIPSANAEFTNISDSENTNVYTIYFSYYKDYGWLGTALSMAALGFICTWIYAIARNGNPIGTMLYGATTFGVIFSFQAEHFFLSLNFYIKLVIVTSAVYYLCSRSHRVEAPVRQKRLSIG